VDVELHISGVSKDQVAEVLIGIATLLELNGENPFKTRAYLNAARTIETMSEPLDKVVAEGRLGEMKGIGEGIQKKITELVTTGKLAYYEELKAATPPGLVAMLEIPGLGPKKIKALHDELGIETVEQLEQACQGGQIAGLKGFWREDADKYPRRHPSPPRLCVAPPHQRRAADGGAAAGRRCGRHPDVIRCSAAGSLRRHREVIGDIDLLASSKKPVEVIEFFTRQPGILNVIAKARRRPACCWKAAFNRTCAW